MFFVRTENFQQFIRFYPVITALAAIHIILFLLTEVIPLNGFLELKALLIGNNYLVQVEDEYWRLFTPIFVHLSLTHVVFNTFSLVLFGPALEVMLGKVKFILAYLFMGIIGNVFTLYVGSLLMCHFWYVRLVSIFIFFQKGFNRSPKQASRTCDHCSFISDDLYRSQH